MSTIYFPETTLPIQSENRGPYRSNRASRSIVAQGFFILCLVFVGSVSAWDAWLVEANEQILNDERNPVCEFLISLEPKSKIYFFVGKGISSLSVLGVLIGLHRYGYRHALLVAAAIAMFQLGLLIHIYLTDNLCGGFPNFALLFRETEEQVFAHRFR